MEVDVQLEAAPKALDRRDRAAPAINDAASASAPTFEAEERAGVDAQDGAAEGVIPGEAIAECVRSSVTVPLLRKALGSLEWSRLTSQHANAARARESRATLPEHLASRVRTARFATERLELPAWQRERGP